MENKKIKLLALDLDGTTLKSNNTLSDKVKASIEKAIASGIEVVIASGRPYASMPESMLSIEGINYCIASNGASIHDKSRNRIHSNLLEESDVLKFLELTKDEDLILEVYINGLTYADKRYHDNPLAYGCGEAYLEYAKASHGCTDDMPSFIYEHRKEIDSFEFICTDKSERERVWKLLENNIEGFYITTSSENFVEIMNKNATKGNAVKWICDRLNIDLSETSACGNADNDVDMIAQSGLKTAVKNASEKCLESAEVILPSNNDDGVATLIEMII